MATMKRVSLTGCKTLHVEAPGCIVNITSGLADRDGKLVTHIEILANGNRYSGEPQWWLDGKPGVHTWAGRVIRTTPEEEG